MHPYFSVLGNKINQQMTEKDLLDKNLDSVPVCTGGRRGARQNLLWRTAGMNLSPLKLLKYP